MKKIYYYLIGAALFLAGSATAQHSTADTLVLRAIADSNFSVTTALSWTDPNPDNWIGVVWDSSNPKRVIELQLANSNASTGNTNTGTGGAKQPTAFSVANINHTNTGVVTNLEGTLDVSGLSELKVLVLNKNTNLTGLNVSGLTKLEYLKIGRTQIATLDISGLTALKLVKAQSAALTSVNASGCTSLVRFKNAWKNNILTSVNFSGCTNLEQLVLKESALTSVNVTGFSKMIKLDVSRSPATASIVGLSGLSKMEGLSIARSGFSGPFDLSGLDSLKRFGAKQNMITTLNGTGAMVGYRTNLDNNRLQLTEAAQLHNSATLTGGTSASPQGPSYWPNDLVAGDSVDFSAEDSVDINGTNAGSSFSLYTTANSLISSNTTGVFNFVVADTGCYYVQMMNSGVTVTTDTFCVFETSPIASASINNMNFGSVQTNSSSTRTLTVTNSGNATLNISSITVPTGYTVSASTGTVAAFSTSNFTVTFSPTAVQTYAGDIMVMHDGPSVSETIAITGMGIAIIDTTTGVMENGKLSMEFYPNPATDVMFVKDNTNKYKSLQLYNMKGELIQEINLNQGVGTIEIGKVSKGIYFVRSADGVIRQKVIRY